MKTLLLVVFILCASRAWSYSVSGTTYSTNGSQSDVQAACSAAPDNGSVTVVIPNGTYSWSGNLSINKSLKLAGQSATGVTINNNNGSGNMISATSTANGHINIYWLNIVQVASNSGGAGFMLNCDRNDASSYTVLVHDCTFNNSAVYSYSVLVSANGIVFWNDTFIGNGSNGLGGISLVCQKYGPGTSSGHGSWNSPSTMGSLDTTGLNNTYIENCTFSAAPTACVNADDNSRVVVRYCTIQDSSLHAHGQDTSIYGVRHYEIYNNTFVNSQAAALNLSAWTYIRGGTFIIANNSVAALPYGKPSFTMICQSINRSDAIACQTGYPAARQIGYGWSANSSSRYGNPVISQDGIGQAQDPAYIWNNSGDGGQASGSYVGISQYSPDDCGNGMQDSNFIVQGRDYYVGTPRPGWSAYTYPHPLHASNGGGPAPTPAPNPTPAAPQNLRVISR